MRVPVAAGKRPHGIRAMEVQRGPCQIMGQGVRGEEQTWRMLLQVLTMAPIPKIMERNYVPAMFENYTASFGIDKRPQHVGHFRFLLL